MVIRKKGFLSALTLAGVAAVAMAAASTAKPGHESQTAAVGEPAPNFTLTDTNGKTHTLADLKGKIVVLEWFNPQCPYVVKNHDLTKTIPNTYNEFKDQGVVWFAINSGHADSGSNGAEFNNGFARKWNIQYPILMDEAGTVGRNYAAKTTPHMYVIDKNGVLAYAGAIDDNNSPNTAGETNYVAQALTQLLEGETVTTATTKPYGCSVKYAPTAR